MSEQNEAMPEAPGEGLAPQGAETLASSPEGTIESNRLFDQEALGQLTELIQAGGPVVMILIAMSIFALALILLKLWQFQSSGMGERRRSRQAIALYRAGEANEALSLVAKAKGPLPQVISLAIRGRLRGDLSDQTVREEVLRQGNRQLENLRNWFRPLEVIASLAPLLGLFGTVLGMIEAFRQLEAAGNQVNPAILSGGIWAALLTTAAGLAVAIPVVAILNWLERRVERLAHEMDDAVTGIFTEDLTIETATLSERWHSGGNKRDAPAGFRTGAVAAGE